MASTYRKFSRTRIHQQSANNLYKRKPKLSNKGIKLCIIIK